MALNKAEIGTAAASLDSAAPRIHAARFTIGFDGFVDEIIHAVDTRTNQREFERLHTIEKFSERVRAAAGKSANIELVPMQVKAGGNGPLMSVAVLGMGGQVTCIGLLGFPAIHPVFAPLAEKATVISVGDPGHTDALEFRDGKIMFGKLHTIKELCWSRLIQVIGADKFKALLLGSDLVACNNWTMLTEMSEIIDQITALTPPGAPVRFFFDLADPEKRSRADLEKVLGQIRTLNVKARCLLGLNLSEAEQVSKVLGLKEMPEENPASVEATAGRIAKSMGLHGVVVHAVKCAGANIGGESAGVEGPYCPNPKLSTGAGDHFNGGFVSGLMGGLSVRDALYSGVGTSGFYVRNARSPVLSDVSGFLRAWSAGPLSDA